LHDEAEGTTRFERVVLPHLDAAYTLARYLTRSSADAEDVVHEAVLRALHYFHTLRSDAEARAWLLTIVRREAYAIRGPHDVLSHAVAYDDATAGELRDATPGPDEHAHHRMTADRVTSAMNALPDVLRETLILREVQDCSYEEIPRFTEVPLGTVMSRLSRGRARLAKQLHDFADTGA
jgi:RNA polymerase sigma factor (sigma-70 family)